MLKPKSQPAQGLVETALILPVLVIMFLGVIEVGMLLRSYLIIVDSSREAARFASKPSQLTIGDISEYENVVDHTRFTAASLGIDFVETGDLIITVIGVDTGWPCDPATRAAPVTHPDGTIDYWPNCDCQLAATNPYTPWLVITDTYQTSSDVQTRIDASALADKMGNENELLNCQAVKTALNVDPSGYHETVVTELFYTHSLLMYSRQKIDLYGKTAMRRVSGRDEND